MPIARILGVEHVAQDENLAGVGGGIQQLNLTLATIVGSNNANPRIAVNGDKMTWGRRASATSTPPWGIIGIKVSSLLGEKFALGPAGLTAFTIGFRATKLAGATGTFSLFGLSAAAPTTSSTGIFNGFNYSNGSWRTNLSGSTTVIGTANEIYLEMVVRISGNTAWMELWADGVVVLASSSTSLAWISLINAGYLMFGAGINGGSPAHDAAGTAAKDYIGISDVYVTVNDGTPNDPYPDRLGPIHVKRVPVASANQADFTTTNGDTLKNVISLRRDINGGTDNTVTPYATSGASAAAATVTLDPSALTGDILALQINTSASKPAGQAGNLNVVVQDGAAATVLDRTYTDLPTDIPFYDRALLPIAAISGAPLSKANIAALSIAVKPS